MTTLREELNRAGFDWGMCDAFVVQAKARHVDDGHLVGYQSGGDGLLRRPENLCLSSPKAQAILDFEFSCGYGTPEMPRFYARDSCCIYFAWQHDGSTGIARCPRDPKHFVESDMFDVPFPGG